MTDQPTPNLAEIVTVQVHAWRYIGPHDGFEPDITYADAQAGEDFDGWGVYLRTPDPTDQFMPFDVTHEEDFPTKERALAYAAELAALHGAEIDVY